MGIMSNSVRFVQFVAGLLLSSVNNGAEVGRFLHINCSAKVWVDSKG